MADLLNMALCSDLVVRERRLPADLGGDRPHSFKAAAGTGGSSQDNASVRDVVSYLKSGYPILDVMELTTDVIGGAFRVPGGSSVLTDGQYVWREDLAWYVEQYNIDLPRDFLETARSHGFRTPPADPDALLNASLEVSRALGFQQKP
ncbi:hypothetical protein [Streptomyces collinus]|uniref:hypothetical protein n=1 Tax=Streptomyces collinus TaxID=42684 RepID=UPI00341E390E